MRTLASARNLLLTAFTSFAFISAGPALAQATDTPSTVPGVEIIDSAQAKALMDKGVKMYDVRVPGDYAEMHIKGAISLPYTSKSENVPNFDASKDIWDVTKLPADKAVPIIIQGNAPAGWRHYKASVLAVKAGHKKVYWLRNGINEWKAKGFPTE
ncbi:MAG: rhodanese-like domain-containing protein [Rhodocyclaceae bacterium]|nr:rhodanese-like domain-containing protein [Rhodocyclaceae bacterium]